MEYHNCRLCDDKYETHPSDGKSNKLNIYLKYLGFCQPECWDKLEKEDQHKELMFAYIYGDSRKQNRFKVKL